MSHTFCVNDVEAVRTPGNPRSSGDLFRALIATDRRALEALREAFGDTSHHPEIQAQLDHTPLAALHASRSAPLSGWSDLHPFVDAFVCGFNEHRPVSFSPDHLWALILQGVSHHIRLHADELRGAFVSHEGKLALCVRRDDFGWRDPANPWEEVFASFCDQIRSHIGPQAGLWTEAFSTTGAIEQAVLHLSLMDSMKHYFYYQFVSLCGIPEITVEGTPADWRALCARIAQLPAYGLGWWVDVLTPIAEECLRACEGAPTLSFWRSFVRYDSISGGAALTGWITQLFPYTDKGERNPVLGLSPAQMASEGSSPRYLDTGSIPRGLHDVPFTWSYLGTTLAMKWTGGFVGTSTTEAGARRPELGWAVLGPDSNVVEPLTGDPR